MSDDQVPEASVIRVLSGLDARVLPDDLERARARRRFEDVLKTEFSQEAPSASSSADVQGLAELPRLLGVDERPNRVRWVMAVAASLVLVWGGVGLVLSARDETPADVQSPTPVTSTTTSLPAQTLDPSSEGSSLGAGRYRVELAGRSLSFEIDQEVDVRSVTSASVILVPVSPERGEGERVSVVAAVDLFDTADPGEWVDALGVVTQSFGRTVDGVGRREWSISQSAGECELFTVCPPLAASVPSVGINAGGQTRVVAVIDEGRTPIAIVSTYQNVAQDGPTFDLYNSITATFDGGE